jgi:two-component sensor histidine kinase
MIVSLTDDGVGIPHSLDVANAGLGLQIVESLITGELRGNMKLRRGDDGGTSATLTLPLIVV